MKLLPLLLLPGLCFAKDIEYFNYKFSIPENYSIYDGEPAATGSNMIHVINENKKGVASVNLVKKKKKNFFSLNYYKMESYRELFHILYSDKPSDNPVVIDFRKFNNEHKLQKFEISERDGFAFFKTINPMDLVGESGFLISTPLNDEVLNITFTGDEKIMKAIIDSLRVK